MDCPNVENRQQQISTISRSLKALAREIEVPIIAGLMPVTSISGMKRMAELAAGARYPAKLMRSLERANGDSEAVSRIGIHYAAEQCADLLDQGVDGIHFYTLNKSLATREIYHSLGLSSSRG